MATSGDTTFTLNRNAMVNSSFRTIGVGVRGETLSATEMADGSEALNILLKSWDSYGLPIWRRDYTELTLVADQNSYTFGPSGADQTIPRPLRILEINRKTSAGNESELTIVSLEEWARLPNKTSTGTPVSAYFDPTLDSSTLSVWPMPDAATAAEYTVGIWYHSPVEDMDNSNDNFDCPPEWLRAIKYNLAYDLSDEYSVPDNIYYRIKGKATSTLKLALDFDVEDAVLQFQPDKQGL